MLRSVAALPISVLAALVLAAPAQAAPVDRYAAPAGSGPAPCVQANPCSLAGALGAAVNGDDVLLLSGTYAVSSQATVPSGADLRPAPGAGRPKLVLATGAQVRVSGTSTIAEVELVKDDASSALHLSGGATGERLYVHGTVPAGGLIGVEVYANTILRDSIVAVNGPNAVAVQSSGNGNTYATTLRNDTLIATGVGAVAADLSPVGPGTETHHVVNTILSGTGNDLVANAPNAAGKVVVNTHFSNYTTVKSVGPGTKTVTAQGKQAAEPQFVSAPADASTGDYHQVAASPTVNAGTVSDPYALSAGTTDVDGDARVVGSAVDIGADELAPPSLPQPPTPVDPGTGETPGPSDPGAADPGADSGDPQPGGATPAPGPSAGGAPPKAAPAPLAAVKSVRVTLAGRVVALKLACPKGASACGGTVSLKAGKAKLGAATLRIAAGRTATVRVSLSKKGAKTVARYGRKGHRVDAVVTTGTRTKAAKVLLRGR